MTTRVAPVPVSGADLKWLNATRDTINDAYAGTTTTATRPPTPVIGQHTFDTTIGRPIWCRSLNPVVWVDGAGTVV